MKKVVISLLAGIVGSNLLVAVALANPSPTGCAHGQGLVNAQSHNQKSDWCTVTPPPPPPDAE